MSKGLSWRQRLMLHQLLRLERKARAREPVAWRELDYGPTRHEGTGEFYEKRTQWNIEQAQRRALRGLERRGLVELGQYSFVEETTMSGFFLRTSWFAQHPDRHVPGQNRYMTGVLLTEAGRQLAAADRD
jgi:hypothetical protein